MVDREKADRLYDVGGDGSGAIGGGGRSGEVDVDGEIGRVSGEGRDIRGRFVLNSAGGPGRPRGRRGESVSVKLRKMLEEDGGSVEVARALLDLATSGKRGAVEAARLIMDRVEGPVTRKLELDGMVHHKTVVLDGGMPGALGVGGVVDVDVEDIPPADTLEGDIAL